MLKWPTVLLCGFMYSWSAFLLEVDAVESCLENCVYYAGDAECTNRGLSAVPTACPEAHTLDISSNRLESLQPSAFSGYLQLSHLYLENNSITYISAGAFNNVKHQLILLNISYNILSRIRPNTYVNMTLKYLLLSHNRISEISPGAFIGMSKLATICLKDNRLTSLEYSIFSHMPKLREINLRNNLITAFDVSFISYALSLQKIFIQNNSIAVVTGRAETEQSVLTVLNLTGNQLQSFSCSVLDNLSSLHGLYLADNSLQTMNGCEKHQFPILKMSNNPFHCDCRLTDMVTWLGENPDDPSPNCSTPPRLQGTPIRDVVLDCANDEDMLSATATYSTYYRIQRQHSTTEEGNKNRPTLSERWPKSEVYASLESMVPSNSLVQSSSNGDDGVDKSYNHHLMEYQSPSPSVLQGVSTFLFVILITSLVLSIVVMALFCAGLKYYCTCGRNLYEDGKTNNSTFSSPIYPEVTVETGEEPTIHLTNNHHYESIKEGQPRTTPRQYSTYSKDSHVAMTRTTHGSEGYHRNSVLCNHGVGTHDHCCCECHEGTSDGSGSWTDGEGYCSDVSYETDNHINDISECLPFQSNSCAVPAETMYFTKTIPIQNCRVHENIPFPQSSLNNGYPPATYEVNLNHPSPPPLPLKYPNEMYIQHNQLCSYVEDKIA